MRCVLFHEVSEYIRIYLGLDYDGHDLFRSIGNVLWAVCKTNQDVLFGDMLVELVT